MNENKVIVAMSGGVDSSVAVKLLLDKGFEVAGITMMVNQYFDASVEQDAKAVAEKLNIEHHTINLTKEFDKKVIKYFTDEYIKGRTPNPCVMCNPEIKFGEILKKCNELDAKFLATGHYALIEEDLNKKLFKLKNIDNKKDQSYFLWKLSQEQLSRTIFPLAGYAKEQIRKIAKEIGLNVAEKPDSQETCFVNESSYREFLYNKIPDEISKIKKGDFIYEGEVIGKHQGYYNYTVGQRRGLGIAVGKPAYVTHIDAKKNEVVIGDKRDLLTSVVKASEVNFVSTDKFEKGEKVFGKIRFNNQAEEAEIIDIKNDSITVEFKTPKSGVAPGQSLVLYDKDGFLLAGGVIE